jgi:hypothetical protein
MNLTYKCLSIIKDFIISIVIKYILIYVDVKMWEDFDLKEVDDMIVGFELVEIIHECDGLHTYGR